MSSIDIRKPLVEEMDAIYELRGEVFDELYGALGSKNRKGNSDDKESTIHIAAFVDGAPVCTTRMSLQDDGSYLVRRMATKSKFQNQGLGSQVLRAAEDEAYKRGGQTVFLHAAQSAVGFYSKLGYKLTGESEIHDGHEDLTMVKELGGE